MPPEPPPQGTGGGPGPQETGPGGTQGGPKRGPGSQEAPLPSPTPPGSGKSGDRMPSPAAQHDDAPGLGVDPAVVAMCPDTCRGAEVLSLPEEPRSPEAGLTAMGHSRIRQPDSHRQTQPRPETGVARGGGPRTGNRSDLDSPCLQRTPSSGGWCAPSSDTRRHLRNATPLPQTPAGLQGFTEGEASPRRGVHRGRVGGALGEGGEGHTTPWGDRDAGGGAGAAPGAE